MTDAVIKGKVIVLGVSGGIAAYKAVGLASKLTKMGATVKIVMTENATKFVGPITFQSVTGQPVLTDLFAANPHGEIYHTSLSEEADLVVTAPATANILAKAACGLADDALSTTLLAARNTIVMVPAMNNYMWLNKATQHNLEVLRGRGIKIIEPEVGELACGEENAIGRFPKTEIIIDNLRYLLSRMVDLAGRTVLVTAGGTHEPIDPVRFIGNHSSGKMGYAIAEAARVRGAEVILVSGPVGLNPPHGVRALSVKTAQQMYDAVMSNLESADVIVMAAAVADFRPSRSSIEKIKKDRMPRIIELELNIDILQAVSQGKGKRIVVGFAAESENIIDNAIDKINSKNLDLIVANDIAKQGVGFGSDLNLAVLIDRDGPLGDLETLMKTELADMVLDWVSGELAKRSGN